VIGLAATLIGGYPIFKEAFENIIERRMTMELSMTIALVSALAIGEFFTALVIAGFVLAAEILEGLTVGADAEPSSRCWISFRRLRVSYEATRSKRSRRKALCLEK
jgi:cation transport ATPase